MKNLNLDDLFEAYALKNHSSERVIIFGDISSNDFGVIVNPTTVIEDQFMDNPKYRVKIYENGIDQSTIFV